jgi:penicillin amidase
MSWGLNMSWHFDPLYTKLAARLHPQQMAEIFPFDFGGSPSAHPRSMSALLAADLPLFELSPAERALLETVPSLRASNNWVLGPSKTTTGAAILANDPHLGHGAPGIWYEVHLKTPTQDVTGVTIPGLPLVIIGHNRDIAWGFTNVMLDGADFFAEKLRPGSAGEVMSQGEWVKLEERTETILVKGADPVSLVIRSTPHGPLVSELMPDQAEALSYRWNYFAPEGNEIEAIYALNRARNWDEFRDAVRHFGAVSQNVAYADRSGHIGLQTTGLIPRLKGKLDGSAIRAGWDGSEDWDGFIPFEENPSSFDPPEGWLASANNPTVPRSPYYISSQWEPVDRYLRVREMITSRPQLSLDDVKKMHMDTLLVSAREITPMLESAFRDRSLDSVVAAALAELRAWDADMKADRAAPTLFAVFYRRLFYAIFEDEFGSELARAYRAHANVSAIMLEQVMRHGPELWFDRIDTPAREDRAEILRSSFAGSVRELVSMLGDDPASWRWGRLHTITFRHALGRGSWLLAPYFDRGPFAVPGHTSTVNKMEFDEADFEVRDGPSMRQITDLGDLERSLAVLPMGQSGIPASPHYDDMLPLWLSGGYHPFAMDRTNIDKSAEGRLVLEP